MAYDFTWFKQILEKWNITLSEQQEHQFGTYYEMLIEKNKVMNLTAFRLGFPDQVVHKPCVQPVFCPSSRVLRWQ